MSEHAYVSKVHEKGLWKLFTIFVTLDTMLGEHGQSNE